MNMDPRRQIVGVLTIVAIISGVMFMSRVAMQPTMTLLYSNLPPQDSGEVISSLDGAGVEYEIRGNSIYVPSDMRDQMRLTLAGQGLPATGGDGYELLDNLTGFGTTSQMFDAAYLRAKEGELARTILANPQIKAARVHIAKGEATPFSSNAQPSASVSLRTTGRAVAPETAEAIRHLVASAMEGMDIKDVAIINADRGLVIPQAQDQSPERAGQSRAEILKQNVERLVAARAGFGRAVVEVNVDTTTEAELVTERLYNPDQRVAISTDSQESSVRSSNSQGQDVTVASNLPDGDAGGQGQSSNEESDTREIVNYEVSQTTREMRRDPGSVRRITVAVLVDGTRELADDGTETFTPRSDEEIQVLEELVKSAVGFDEARGDLVTIRSMDLPKIEAADTVSGEDAWVTGQPINYTELMRMGIVAAVVLGLGIFVLRPLLASSGAQATAALPAPDTADAPPALPGPEPLTGQIDEGPAELVMGSGFPTMGGDDAMGGDFPTFSMDGLDENPVDRLKSLIEERQEETVEVLKNWIEGTKEPTP